MPITKQQGYVDSNGAMHATVEEAQLAELKNLLHDDFASVDNDQAREDIALFIQRRADAILGILTTGPRTRVKARKTVGTTNPRRAARRVVQGDNNGLTAQLAEQHG